MSKRNAGRYVKTYQSLKGLSWALAKQGWNLYADEILLLDDRRSQAPWLCLPCLDSFDVDSDSSVCLFEINLFRFESRSCRFKHNPSYLKDDYTLIRCFLNALLRILLTLLNNLQKRLFPSIDLFWPSNRLSVSEQLIHTVLSHDPLAILCPIGSMKHLTIPCWKHIRRVNFAFLGDSRYMGKWPIPARMAKWPRFVSCIF